MKELELYLQFARNIKKRCKSDASLRLGLCKLFLEECVNYNKVSEEMIHGDNMYIYIMGLFRTWKGFSGSTRYPIEIYTDVALNDQFDQCRSFYAKPLFVTMFHKDRFFARRYIKARRALLDYIISELEYKLK